MGQETVTRWRTALTTARAGYPGPEPRPPGAADPRTVGPYRVEAVLGQGGMGRVYLARDSRDDTAGPVALKVLTRTADATAAARFRRELAAARRVSGPGTARVLDGDPEAHPPWLATEYVPGPTLDQLLAARGPLGARAAAALAVGVAGALTAIHAAGVVHRDLKPANIILAQDGPRLVDFGIARADDATTLSVTGWTLGTPGYMAPEQIARPREAGPAVDVFALGAVLVFATTGLSPYAGGDPSAVLYRIVHGTPVLDGVPAPLLDLVSACLARDPDARPRVEAVAAAALRLVDELDHGVDDDSAGVSAADGADMTTAAAVRPGVAVRAAAPTGSSSAPTGSSSAPTGPSAPRRRRRGALGLLAALVVAAVGTSSWYAVDALGRPSRAPASATGSKPLAAASVTTGGGSTAGATGSASPFIGTLSVGPGCPAQPWVAFSITSTSLETGVGGGDPACGGQADAFRKAGTAAGGGSRAVWSMDFHRRDLCILRIYVPDTNPSSGIAVYQVTVNGETSTFPVDQAQNKGRYVTPAATDGLVTDDGRITLTLTDISANAGDRNHVTASGVIAECVGR